MHVSIEVVHFARIPKKLPRPLGRPLMGKKRDSIVAFTRCEELHSDDMSASPCGDNDDIAILNVSSDRIEPTLRPPQPHQPSLRRDGTMPSNPQKDDQDGPSKRHPTLSTDSDYFEQELKMGKSIPRSAVLHTTNGKSTIQFTQLRHLARSYTPRFT